MAIQVPFPIPSKGYALNSKLRVNLDFIVAKFNEFNTGTATWDNVSIGTPSDLTGTLTFYNDTNPNYLSFKAGVTAANITYTLPTAGPASSGSVLQSTTGGALSWTAAPTFTSVESTEIRIPNTAIAGPFDTVLKCHPNTATDYDFYFPTTNGSAGQFLASDGTYCVWVDNPVNAGLQTRMPWYANAGSAAVLSDHLTYTNGGLYVIAADHSGIATDRTYTIPNVGKNSAFVMEDSTPTFPGLTITAPGGIDLTTFFIRGISGNNRTTFYRTDGGSNIDWYFPNAQGAASTVLTNDGAGNLTWSLPTGVSASKALDNLASVAINTSLVSDTDQTDDLGSTSIAWNNLYSKNLYAGRSGVAGFVYVYPPTASKGWLVLTKESNTSSNSETQIHVADQSASRVYTVPDAGASTSFVMAAGAQQINGAKTFGESITSDTDNTDDLGSSSIGWRTGYFKTSVGIGTAAPLAPLDIKDSIFIDVVDALPIDKDAYVGIMRTAATGSAPFNQAGSLILRPRVSSVAGRGSVYIYTGSPPAMALHASETGAVAIKGTNTNDNAAAGYIGEYVTSSVSTFTNIGTSNQYYDITSISLTAGDWDIHGTVWFVANTGSGMADFSAGISTTSGNSSTGLVLGYSRLGCSVPASTGGDSVTLVIRASLSGSATYYLKGNATYSSGNPQHTGTIWARRVR